ncbi:Integrase core domain protein [Candidatus Arcanobacter lacustris]|uniref:Integrase core domain protein n=1 Tax=Candidatus Arcanibacter lacustris TaxID=1607817 RepID=A0A0F5MQV5_9RICK|nr:Integrase core domain protein [Candidatus Arcanobacter lacustris]KKB96442.1 Integrase core domain protein [Candidatus Arcanobacter lacustris]
MLDPLDEEVSVRHQARLLGVCRSKIYYKPIISDDNFIANEILEIYGNSDCRYGYRKIHASLLVKGLIINKKKIQRMMKNLGLQGLYPKKKINTTIKNELHKIYPYLLKNVNITRSNQVWCSDITYIWVENKFMYFIAIIDLHSRYIVSYGLSYSLEADFYVEILKNSLVTARPEIFNTDQGSQFTSNGFINILIANKIAISMDHQGRCFDNIHVERLWRTVKQEAVYYYKPETVAELEKVLNEFVIWYNNERIHQALLYKTPREVYYGMKKSD